MGKLKRLGRRIVWLLGLPVLTLSCATARPVVVPPPPPAPTPAPKAVPKAVPKTSREEALRRADSDCTFLQTADERCPVRAKCVDPTTHVTLHILVCNDDRDKL